VRVKDGEIRKVLKAATAAGCTVDAEPSRNQHGVLRGSDGRVISRFPLGATDWRAARNLRAAIRRAGVEV
jgi:hypothetical protein